MYHGSLKSHMYYRSLKSHMYYHSLKSDMYFRSLKSHMYQHSLKSDQFKTINREPVIGNERISLQNVSRNPLRSLKNNDKP